MKYITILDFERAETHIFPYDLFMEEDFVDIAKSTEDEYGIKFSEKNCQWMIQYNLKLQIH